MPNKLWPFWDSWCNT